MMLMLAFVMVVVIYRSCRSTPMVFFVSLHIK